MSDQAVSKRSEAKSTRQDRYPTMVVRFAEGVLMGDTLSYRRPSTTVGEKSEPLQVRQSDLDQACGLHCVVMTMMLMMRMPRDKACGVANSRSSRLKALWRAAAASYFEGGRTKSLVAQLRAAAPELEVRSRMAGHRSNAKAAIETVERGGSALALLGFSKDVGQHWVLLVGVEYFDDEPMALLGVDPDEPLGPLALYNCRLQLVQPRTWFSPREAAVDFELKSVICVLRHE